MRCLHVIDSLDVTPVGCALLALLRTRQKTSSSVSEADTHDVLAFAGGALEDRIRGRARRVLVAAGGLDVAAVLHGRAYEVVHALDAASAHRLAPLVLGSSVAALVYSGRLLARVAGGPTYGRAADESLVAACDLAILDATTEPAFDPRLDQGGRIARLDLARSGQALLDRDTVELELLATTDFALREWLSLLSRAAAAAV